VPLLFKYLLKIESNHFTFFIIFVAFLIVFLKFIYYLYVVIIISLFLFCSNTNNLFQKQIINKFKQEINYESIIFTEKFILFILISAFSIFLISLNFIYQKINNMIFIYYIFIFQ